MTNTYNIAGTDGSVMVPVLSETDSLMAYLLYPNPTGVLQEYYPQLSISVPVSDQSQSFSLQCNTHSGTTLKEVIYQGVPFIHKRAFGWTGQPIIPTMPVA